MDPVARTTEQRCARDGALIAGLIVAVDVLRPAIHLAVIDGETPTQRIGDRASDRRIDIPFGGLRLVAHLDRPGKLAGRVSGTDVESAGDRVLAKARKSTRLNSRN